MGDACDPCIASADPACQPTLCTDADGDGYGIPGASACPGGFDRFDCNDSNRRIYPGAFDGCGGGDEDCDGQTDEDCPQSQTTFVYDANGNMVEKREPGPTMAAQPDLLAVGRLGGWRFEEASGAVAEDVTGKNPAELFQVARSPGVFGGGLLFEDSNAQFTPYRVMRAPDSPNIRTRADRLTISMWVKLPSARGVTFASKGWTYQLVLNDRGIRWFDYSNGYAQSTTNILVDNVWSHIAVTFGNQRVKLYHNGVLVGESPRPQNLNYGLDPFMVGERVAHGVYFDEVGLWDRELPAEEIMMLATGPIVQPPPPPPPVPPIVTEYVYDARDRMVEVKKDGVRLATYGYDTQGLRVAVADSSGDRRILLNGVEELAEYEAGAMSQVARWDRDPTRIDSLLAQHAGSTTYAITDALGSVSALVDASGIPVMRRSFDVFGQATTMLEAASTPWSFTGRRADSTGLSYYRLRHYDPSIGVFTQDDPAGLIDGPNRYAYVRGNPVGETDPAGLSVDVWTEPLNRRSGDKGALFAAILKSWWFFDEESFPRHTYIQVQCHNRSCTEDFPPSFRTPLPVNRRLELSGPLQQDGRARGVNVPFRLDPASEGSIQWRDKIVFGPHHGTCALEVCLAKSFGREIARIPKYGPEGPNSNTFAFDVLWGCNVLPFLNSSEIGWDFHLYNGRE